MITKVEVDGFKSLTNFSLALRPGLNVLVGPNGVGKTNITLFLEFLSKLAVMPVGEAVREVGGAGSIFRKIGEDNYVDTIRATVHGCTWAKDRFLSYRYQFEISISAAKDRVYFSHQEIRIRYVDTFVTGHARNKPDEFWPLAIVQHSGADESCEIEILKFDRRIIKNRFPIAPTTKRRSEHIVNLKEFIEYGDPLNNSLVDIFTPYVQFFFRVLFDLRDGETFNIIPSKVRELEDSATTPGINRDGSGLTATLYAIQRGSYGPESPISKGVDPSWQLRFQPNSWESILDHLRSANSSISTIEISNSPFDNKLVVKVKIATGDYSAVLPLSALSDGTIKWLTLITAIFTSKSIFSIEEPENFLHPWMQAEIATIMRSHLEGRVLPAFVLMTTHSESLLNFVKPDEIVVVSMKNGSTKASRLKRPKEVRKSISESGFGLGFFYFSNALSDA